MRFTLSPARTCGRVDCRLSRVPIYDATPPVFVNQGPPAAHPVSECDLFEGGASRPALDGHDYSTNSSRYRVVRIGSSWQDCLTVQIKLSTKGQVVLPNSIRRRLGLRLGDSLDAKIEGERIVLTPRRPRARKMSIVDDPLTGLPVLSAGTKPPSLTSKQVQEILSSFPRTISSTLMLSCHAARMFINGINTSIFRGNQFLSHSSKMCLCGSQNPSYSLPPVIPGQVKGAV